MNPMQRIVLAALLVGISASVATASGKKEHRRSDRDLVAPGGATSAVYVKECGACHLAYQPQFLPKRSWEKTMDTLDQHFGESATLDEATGAEIRSYLVTNSAETSSSRISGKVLATIDKTETPIRVSDTPYFKREHRKIRADDFKRKSIGSPANCGACHPLADKGDYNEHNVKIPRN